MMAQFVSRLREWHSLRALPAPVGAFYRDALALARANDDIFSLGSVSRPTHLATLLELARGRTTLVELGTCTAWTSIALALHEPAARVLTFDPVVHAQRERYLALVAPEVRGRIALIAEPGADGAHHADAVELLFIDATHERAPTVAEFRAWRPRLAAGAIVVFDDYGHPDYPGVAEAVADLDLTGEVHGALFVTRADGSG